MNQPLILWGATGQAHVIYEFADRVGYEVVALFDNNPEAVSPWPNVPLYHGQAGFETWRDQHPGDCAFAVAIGGHHGAVRLSIHQQLLAAGLSPATLIHPTAYVARDATLGPGCQVLAQATVCAGTTLGKQCIINTAASIDHESILEDGVHLAPGARLAGCVHIGQHTMVGLGSVVLPRVRIGSGVIIGASTVVPRDIASSQVVYDKQNQMIRKLAPSSSASETT